MTCSPRHTRLGQGWVVLGNSLSHLMLAVSASLQQGVPDASVGTFSDASLHAFCAHDQRAGPHDVHPGSRPVARCGWRSHP